MTIIICTIVAISIVAVLLSSGSKSKVTKPANVHIINNMERCPQCAYANGFHSPICFGPRR